LVVVIALLGVMVIDGIITYRRGVFRVGGRVVAHVAFLIMILAVIIIAKAGRIL